MGLPLFIAPVQSDLPSKTAAKSPADPATARSPIRRADRRRQLNETRQHRLRLLAALQGNDAAPHEIIPGDNDRPRPNRGRVADDGRPRRSLTEVMTARSQSRRTARPVPMHDAIVPDPVSFDFDSDYEDLADLIRAEDEHRERLDEHRERLNEHRERLDGHRERLNAIRHERRDALRPTDAGPGTDAVAQEESYIRGDRIPDPGLDLWAPSRVSSSRETSTPQTRYISMEELANDSGRLRPPVIRPQSSYESAPASRSSRSHQDPGEYLHEYRRRRNMQRGTDTARVQDETSSPRLRGGTTRFRPRAPRAGRYVRYMDGLGDRDRSLSPEGDSVWDTLQSTLTPDPQPPSVGSSFASTNVSAAASQTTLSSSNTSITNPDEELEPPCDSVDEDAEPRDEERSSGRTTSRRPTPHGGRRSYADVAADSLPLTRLEGDERLEWLSDMQRIVQDLASQEDIPDHQWAAAGLSRSMAWDDEH
ncbi:hypothetical protein BJ170DRAFT_191195 [Xylariales sp. AK1849]|nr:hypothetical protein BJ170DRAFT_191195 [Xylariales sp. AK1849]